MKEAEIFRDAQCLGCLVLGVDQAPWLLRVPTISPTSARRLLCCGSLFSNPIHNRKVGIARHTDDGDDCSGASR